jgi:CRISPR-associated protein Csm5
MNRFIDVVPLALTPLTPIHVGCGIDFEPTNYIIDNGVLYHFEPSNLDLEQTDRVRLLQAIRKTGVDAILEVQKFFHQRSGQCRQANRLAVPVAAGVIERYEKVGKVSQRDADGRKTINQLAIERTTHHPHTGKPYLPGSSLKGSLRTGWLNDLDPGPQVGGDRGRGPDRGTASAAEEELLHGSFSSDPFRLLDVVDASGAELQSSIVFAVNRRKRQRPDRGEQSRPQDLSVCCEVISGGQFRGLQSEIRFVRPPATAPSGNVPAPERRIGDFTRLAHACNGFYRKQLNCDLDLLKQKHLSAGLWVDRFRDLIKSLQPLLDQGKAMLVRVGRHSGAESVTLGRRRWIRIMEGPGKSHWASEATTIWLAAESDSESAEMLPFGWLLVERADASAPESLKQWCDEQSRRFTPPTLEHGHEKSGATAGDEIVWPKARLKYNKGNGTLTATGPGNAQAHAHAPRGEEILSDLPQPLQQKVRTNQFVRLSVRVRGSELVGIEP